MPTTTDRTHREVKKPVMDIRFLAEYMAASGRERARKSIIQGCRYQKLARLYHHKEAKAAILLHFKAGGGGDLQPLADKAQALRDRIADEQYERNLYDYNADYLDAFVEAYALEKLPSAELLPAPPLPEVIISGVTLRVELFGMFRRFMRGSNRERLGALMLRYKKGEAVPLEVRNWQSAILFGYLSKHVDMSAAPEQKLCVTLDVVSGEGTPAPSDSIERFSEAEAACAMIADAWANMKPPAGAIL